MVDQKKAYTYGLITVLLWSTVASAFKLSLRRMDPAQLVLYASLASLLVLGAILAAQGRLGRLFTFSRKQYLRSLAMGIMNPFLYYLILFQAYDLLPAQEAQPINYTWAITLALLSIPLLKQKIGRNDLLGAFVSYGGVLVISTRGEIAGLEFTNPVGVGLALLSTIIWALYWIYSTKDDREPVPGLFLNFLFGLPFVAVYVILFSEPVVTDGAALAGAFYVGCFEMGVTFVTWLTALRYSENTAKVGNLIFISPFVSLILIHFIVGEDIYPSTYPGLGLIIGGLLIQQIWRPHRRG